MALNKSNLLAWDADKKNLVKSYSPKTDKVFSDFDKEVKQRKLVGIVERNKLWNVKYAPRLKKIEDAEHKDYSKIWEKYFGGSSL